MTEPKPPLELRPKRPAVELVYKRQTYGTDECRHLCKVVDEATRSVSCEKCGAPFDAFTVLSEVARDGSNLAYNEHTTKREVALAQKRLDDLKRIESNARSRLKRTGTPLPTKHDHDESLSGLLRAWTDAGVIHVYTPTSLKLTGEQAREVARKLVMLALELEAKR